MSHGAITQLQSVDIGHTSHEASLRVHLSLCKCSRHNLSVVPTYVYDCT